MQDVMRAIQEKTALYEQRPLFTFLRDTTIAPRRRLAFAPSAAHYILTFTDFCQLVLREEPAKDRLQEIVNAQTYEEAAHSSWFLQDLAKLGHDPMVRFSDALRFVWNDATAKSRLLSYHLCRLALGADSLRKLVLVQCVEATAEVTIRHVMMVGRAWTNETGKNLDFFGKTHEDAEEHHSLWEQGTKAAMQDIELNGNVRDELLRLVDEAFHHFTEFTDELLSVAHLERTVQ